jgi:hypothetical protein
VRTFLTLLPAIGCLVMMLVMCGPMMLKRNRSRSSAVEYPTSFSKDVAELRDEVSSLKAKLALQEGSDAGKTQ